MTDVTPYVEVAAPFAYGGLLLLVRLAVMVTFVPGFAETALPTRARIPILLVLTLALDFALGGVYVEPPEQLLTIVLTVFREVVIGFGMGFAVRLISAAVEAAGDIAGLSMALSASALFDPQTGEQQTAVGSLLAIMTAMIFVAMDGHHIVFVALFEHAERFPVGEIQLATVSLSAIAGAASELARTALMLAAPVVVVSLMVNMGLAFVSRVVPSVNLFGIGLSILLIAGLLALTGEGRALVQLVELRLQDLPERMVEMTGHWNR